MKNINDLLIEKGNYTFDVNNWGSCQYSGALAMYNAYFVLRNKYSKELVLQYLEYEYGFKVSFHKIRDDEQAIDMFFKIYANKRNWNFDIYDYDEIEKLDEHNKKLIRTIRRAKSADDLFFIGRNASSDLWSTAPKIAESYFTGFKTENLPDSNNPSGLEKGPVGNICAQANNILTGLCCALLIDYDIVKNINSFKGFDT
jgi:hypothetical protein